jgi:hypothetical protein
MLDANAGFRISQDTSWNFVRKLKSAKFFEKLIDTPGTHSRGHSQKSHSERARWRVVGKGTKIIDHRMLTSMAVQRALAFAFKLVLGFAHKGECAL